MPIFDLAIFSASLFACWGLWTVWRRWRRVGIGVTFLVVPVVVFYLTQGAVRFFSFLVTRPWSTYQQVPWQSFATALGATATLAVALGAIVTLYVTTRQKDLEADRKAYRDEFTDMLNRLANKDSVTMRLNAALRLAHLGIRESPGSETQRNNKNYPHFRSAATQLAAALDTEPERVVREAVVKACRLLAGFADVADDSIYFILVYELYDANQRAFGSFIYALAAYHALTDNEIDEEDLTKVAALIRFGTDQMESLRCLRNLMCEPRYEVAIAAQRHFWDVRKPADTGDRATLYSSERQRRLDNIDRTASQLLATGTALAYSIRRRPRPFPMGHVWSGNPLERLEHEMLPRWTNELIAPMKNTPSGLALKNAFMPHADLIHATLKGADLSGAYLGEADLRSAQLEWARLSGAHMERARVEGTFLADATLDGACLWNAQFALVPKEDPNTTMLDRANWWDATFSSGSEEDSVLKEQLAKHWPK